jgi:cytoskeletal protein RodZ
VEELPELQLPIAEHIRPRREVNAKRTSVGWKIPALVLVLIALFAAFWMRHSRSARAEAGPATHLTPAVVATASPSVPVPGTPNAPSVTQPSSAAASHKSTATEEAEDNSPEVIKRTFPAAAKIVPAPKPVKPFTLIIRAEENSHISVTADGQLISEETLIAPAHTSVRGTREVVVKVANAAGVSFLLDGKEIPAQGAESESKTLTFNSTGIRTP